MDAKSKHSLTAFNGANYKAKDKQKKSFKGQMKRVYKAFSEKPKTMLEVSKETKVRRANICRYVAKWRKRDKIHVANYGVCPISKNKKVGFYTTDPQIFIKPKTMR
jgi:hypothetical protein